MTIPYRAPVHREWETQGGWVMDLVVIVIGVLLAATSLPDRCLRPRRAWPGKTDGTPIPSQGWSLGVSYHFGADSRGD